jgi:hypothetical protein
MALAVWAIMVWDLRAFFSAPSFSTSCAESSMRSRFSWASFSRSIRSAVNAGMELFPSFSYDLSIWDIVFGKLAAIITVPFLTVLSVFPSLAVCQLFGGLQSSDLWRSLAALLGTVFFSASVTLFVQVLDANAAQLRSELRCC